MDFFFISVYKFLTIDIKEINNFYLINSKSLKLNTEIKNSGKLLSESKTIDFIRNKINQTGNRAVIIPFKPSGKIEHICQKENWIYAANPAKLNRFLEDKINFSKLCKKHDLPTIPSIIDKFNQENFEKYQQVLNKHLVLQTRFGWAGKSTFSSPNWEDIKDKIPLQTPVKFTPFLSRISIKSKRSDSAFSSHNLLYSLDVIKYGGSK